MENPRTHDVHNQFIDLFDGIADKLERIPGYVD